MLIITRRISEKVFIIDRDNRVTTAIVLGIRGNQIRLGIDAPSDMLILREEVYLRDECRDIRDKVEGKKAVNE